MADDTPNAGRTDEPREESSDEEESGTTDAASADAAPEPESCSPEEDSDASRDASRDDARDDLRDDPEGDLDRPLPFGEPFEEWLYAPGPHPTPYVQGQRTGRDGISRKIWLITMATDYMEPRIIMGDTVAVEMEQDFDAPDTYFFQIGDVHQVAHLMEEEDGTVRIVPANPFYSTMIVDPAEVHLHVHGRVWGRVHRV